MRKIVMFSGGKDSSCLLHQMLFAGEDVEVVFCNTGWELPETIEFIKGFIEQYHVKKFTELQSEKFKSLPELVQYKKYMPSPFMRFCTEELKIKPLKAYVESIDDEVHTYNGVRAEESTKRRKMLPEVYDDYIGAMMHRPLLYWTWEMVIDYLKVNEVPINPVYKNGMKRVGCGPCIMISLKEFAVFKELWPERIKIIAKLEEETGSYFFQPDIVPERFRTARGKGGELRSSIMDVVRYVDSKPKYYQYAEVAGESCMSYYNLCE